MEDIARTLNSIARQRAISNGNNAPGWRMALDAAPIADHDGPRYWMDCPDAPDDGGPEDA